MIDEAFSELADQPLESVAFVAERQRFRESGVTVRADALGVLARADQRGRLAPADRGSPAHASLVDAELADERARLTSVGDAVRAHWRSPSPVLEIERRGAAPGALTAWAGPATLLVAASAPATTTQAPHDLLSLGITSLDGGVPAIAAWIGLRPVWSFADGPADVPLAVYEARLSDPVVPPPADLPSHLRRLWGAEGVEYASRSPQRSVRFVVTGEGCFSVMIRGEDARLATVTPRTIFTTLLSQYSDALEFAAV